MKILLAEQELLDEWHAQLEKSIRFQIAMALATKSGLDLVTDAIEFELDRGVSGQILIGTDLPSEPAAFSTLLKLRRRFSEQLTLRYFQPDKKTRFFHAKLSIFERSKKRTAILGSSNLTNGGFIENVETNVLIDSPKEVKKLASFFEILFEAYNSDDVSPAWLREYKKQWANRRDAMRALRRAREDVAQITVEQPEVKPVPRRIKDAAFVFTGALGPELGEDWIRRTVIERVRRLGGVAFDTPAAVERADCLVEGYVHPYLGKTRKQKAARENNVPRISAERFLRIYERENRLRRQ